MSLLPHDATFEEVIQDCFLAYRGSGLMLNALDSELLGEWASANVPIEVVARGLRVAASKAGWDKRPDEPALQSLRQCRRWVSHEIAKYQQASAGQTQPGPKASGSPEGRWAQSLRKEIKALTEKHAFLGSALQVLQERYLPSGEKLSLERLGWVEELMWARTVRALPGPDRLRLLKAANQDAGQPTSRRARLLARRFHRMRSVQQFLAGDP